MYIFYQGKKEKESYNEKLKKHLNRSVSAKEVLKELNEMRGLNRKDREYV